MNAAGEMRTTGFINASESGENAPKGPKPAFLRLWTARLKPSPSQNLFVKRVPGLRWNLEGLVGGSGEAWFGMPRLKAR